MENQKELSPPLEVRVLVARGPRSQWEQLLYIGRNEIEPRIALDRARQYLRDTTAAPLARASGVRAEFRTRLNGRLIEVMHLEGDGSGPHWQAVMWE